MKKKLFLSIFTAILFFSMLYIPNHIEKNTIKATAISPTIVPLTKYVTANGKIEAASTKEVYIPVPVYPESINVKIGDYVSVGDILAEIDVETTMNILTTQTPIELQITKLTDFISVLPDPSILYEFGNIYGLSEEDIDVILDSTKYNLTEEKTYYIEECIIAAFSGTVTEIGIMERSLNYPDTPAFIISDLSNYKAIIEVSQNDIASISIGMPCTVEAGGDVFNGVIEEISPVAKESIGRSPFVEVTVSLEFNERLKPGYAINCNIPLQSEISSFQLPIEAVHQDENNIEYVYVYKDNMSIKTPIEIASENYYGVQITGGIDSNDLVLITSSYIDKPEQIILLGE